MVTEMLQTFLYTNIHTHSYIYIYIIYSRVFIVILTGWVGFWVGFGFSYTVRIPRRCCGYILLAYIIGQLSYPRCIHTIRLLLATPN